MDDNKLPFYLARPELHLRPLSEFKNLMFIFWPPDYVEDPTQTLMPQYLYISRNGRIGILHWYTADGLFGKKEKYKRIIPCKYEKIDKKADHFVCYKAKKVIYYDLAGNVLK